MLQRVKKHASEQRNDQDNLEERVQAFVEECIAKEGCELHNALTLEHFNFLIKHWKQCRLRTGECVFDKWTREDGDPNTWPKLTDLPPHMRPNRAIQCKEFHGHIPDTGKYPPDQFGVLPSFKPFNEQATAPAGGRHREMATALSPLFGAVADAGNIVIRFENKARPAFAEPLLPVGNKTMKEVLKQADVVPVMMFNKETNRCLREKTKVLMIKLMGDDGRNIQWTLDQFKNYTVSQVKDAANAGSDNAFRKVLIEIHVQEATTETEELEMFDII